MSPVEIVAAVFGLLSVVFTVRQSIWCWPTGIVMVALYIDVFFEARLYSDMGLQVVYLVLQVYGWQQWRRGGANAGPLAVSWVGPSGVLFWGAVSAAGTLALGYAMSSLTDASLPYVDACATALSLVAQWLMVRKVVESWLFWIAVDVLSLGMYWNKGLYPTMVLYGVFLGLAIAGYLSWRRACAIPRPA